ncbi:polysaccharide pyruvyl transferase family protein, partial [Streptomyces sp. DH12]|uniref:polysaccharide pyruvyl transferase family protein n=1 Tax=Streptomyces sp. DH12 TaxID=2857010 RepID=UPI001E642D04
PDTAPAPAPAPDPGTVPGPGTAPGDVPAPDPGDAPDPSAVRHQLRRLLRDRPARPWPGRPARPARALLVGNYGNGNAGDESILASLADLAGGHRDRLTVVSRDPDAVTALHGLRAVRTTSPGAVAAFLRADAVAVGGGGMFGRGLPPLVRVLPAVLLAARLLGKEVHLVALGAYPDTPPATRYLLRRAARGAAAVTVRDTATRRVLSSGPARRVRPVLVPDPATALAPAEPARVEADTGVDPASRPLVVNLKAMPDRTALDQAVDALARALAAWGGEVPVVLLGMSDRGDYGLGPGHCDLALAAELARRAGWSTGRGGRAVGGGRRVTAVGPGLHPSVTKALLGAARGVVAMRLHAQIHAVAQHTALFAVAFEPKSFSFLSAAGVPAHRPGRFSTADVAAWLDALPR